MMLCAAPCRRNATTATIRIARRFEGDNPLDAVRPVLDLAAVTRLAAAARRTHLSDAVLEYAARLGASPRATLALMRTARARATLHGRAYVLPDDVKRLAPAVLGHRIIAGAAARVRGGSADEVVAAVLKNMPAPVEVTA